MPTPPAYTPLHPDATALAQKFRELVEPVLADSRPAITLPPVNAYDQMGADYLLLARGIQFRSVLDAPSGVSGLPPSFYGEAPFGSVTWTPPVARTYWFETQMSMSVTAASPVPLPVRVRLVVGDQEIEDPEAKAAFVPGVHQRLHFLVPVVLPNVSPVVIRWQWRYDGPPGALLRADAGDMRVLRVWA